MFDRKHSFRDPIHGFVRVSDEERELIDTRPFQRLRRIRQLGTGYLVYHGAEHSRFGHSLGVMEVATRVLEAIRRSRPDLLPPEENWRRYEQILRLAALLHDVGHAPFSHASEELFPAQPNSLEPLKHEDYTKAILLNSELAQVINDRFSSMSVTAQDVVNVHSDPSALGSVGVLLQDIVAGELDADRMDYLARDSLYAGVTYGHYDLDRLLDTITAVEDAQGALHLAVEEDGRHALEAFLLARHYMFLQVYLHKYRRFYDVALTKTLSDLLKDEDGKYPLPDDWESFLAKDDYWVLHQLSELARDGHSWARCPFERRHWKVVAAYATGTLDQQSERADPADWIEARREVLDQYTDDAVVPDDARAKNFQRTDPGPYIAAGPEEAEREQPKILILEKRGAARLVEEVSGIVRELSRAKITIRRLYASPQAFDEVSSSWNAAIRKRR